MMQWDTSRSEYQSRFSCALLASSGHSAADSYAIWACSRNTGVRQGHRTGHSYPGIVYITTINARRKLLVRRARMDQAASTRPFPARRTALEPRVVAASLGSPALAALLSGWRDAGGLGRAMAQFPARRASTMPWRACGRATASHRWASPRRPTDAPSGAVPRSSGRCPSGTAS